MSDSLQELADNCGPNAQGTVYLLHFDEVLGDKSNPRGQARHYLGWTMNLEERLANHARGNGDSARIMQVLAERGIGFVLVRTWEGPQALEKRLKRQHNSKRFCPICTKKEGGKMTRIYEVVHDNGDRATCRFHPNAVLFEVAEGDHQGKRGCDACLFDLVGPITWDRETVVSYETGLAYDRDCQEPVSAIGPDVDFR